MSHETDKHNLTEHSYGDAYAEIFSRFNREAELNILELGVQRGGSLFAWREYFPNAKIIGVDISDSRLDRYKTDESITFIKKDLRDAIEDLRDIKFDIIIDDSDHFEGTVAWIVKHYFELLKQHGVMVIEDLQVVGKYTETIKSTMPDYTKYEEFDMREVKGRPDDFIVCLTKQ
jgi:cephalosporin hydroxylase